MTFDKNKYYTDKYHSDPKFRKKRMAWSSEWGKKHRKQINEGNKIIYGVR